MIIITTPTTISAKIVTTLMIENQNSSSPKSLALSKFNDIKINTQNRALIQLGICGNQKLTYFATAVTSAIPVIIQHNQRSEEHTSELQSRFDIVCCLLLEKHTKLYHSANITLTY